MLLLLVFNPTIEKKVINEVKPTLNILVDNSKSVVFFKEDKNVKDIVNSIDNNDLLEKFDIKKYTFGNKLKGIDSLTFSQSQTNISDAVLGINNLEKDKISPIILITDGNQTVGQDYEFINSKQVIYPIVLGDTSKYIDLSIGQLNVNKYSYIKNKFPVEVILNYEGDKNISSQFSITKKGKTVFRKRISFSAHKKSVTLNTNLISSEEGLQFYTASISNLNNEKNINNNVQDFSIEVIDQQTKILLLTSIIHPDLGAFKKATGSNKQRVIDVLNIDKYKGQLLDYQLVIMYQPNNKFNDVFVDLKKYNRNYLLVSGAKTDWNFINQQQLGFSKNAINQTENYGAIYNESFLTFLQEDIGFNNYPPLKDKFGEVNVSNEHQTLLFQNINGIQTNQPLFSTFDINNRKSGIILGEGIWKWRAASFLNSNSFEGFDTFIGNILQFLASNKKRSRLEIKSQDIYPANSTINISAFFTDKNYKFDARASLAITIINIETKEELKIPFSLVNNSFQTQIDNLNSGDYSFKVSVAGLDINKYGRFKIKDFKVEEQFTSANNGKLEKLADKTGGKLIYKNQIENLFEELLNNDSYYTLQKSSLKQQNLIDLKWILFLAIGSFSLEWILRKYYGKI